MPKSVSALDFVVRYPFGLLLLLLVNHIIPTPGNQGENVQISDAPNPTFDGPADPSNSSGSGLAMAGEAGPRDQPVPNVFPNNAAEHPFAIDMNSTDLAVPLPLDPLEGDPLENEPPYDEDVPQPFDAF